MSLALTISPQSPRHTDGFHCDVLEVSASRDMQQAIRHSGHTRPLADGETVQLLFEEDGWQHVTTDAYGLRLAYIPACILAGLIPEETNWDTAVKEFLRALEFDTPVLLYWH